MEKTIELIVTLDKCHELVGFFLKFFFERETASGIWFNEED